MLIGSGLCLTRSSARAPSAFSIPLRWDASGAMQNFVFSAQRSLEMSLIAETPDAVVATALAETWWLLRTVAAVFDAIGVDGL